MGNYKTLALRLRETGNYTSLAYWKETVLTALRELDMDDRELGKLTKKWPSIIKRWRKGLPPHPRPGIQRAFLKAVAAHLEDICGVPITVVLDFNVETSRDSDTYFRYIQDRGLAIVNANHKWRHLPEEYSANKETDIDDLPIYEPELEERYLTETPIEDLEEWIPETK